MAAVCIARIPILTAETLAVRRGDISSYPLRLPSYEYDPGR